MKSIHQFNAKAITLQKVLTKPLKH